MKRKRRKELVKVRLHCQNGAMLERARRKLESQMIKNGEIDALGNIVKKKKANFIRRKKR